MLIDILCELNKLNKKFQYDLEDITSIKSGLEVCVSVLCRLFLCGIWPTFGKTIKNLGKFFKKSVSLMRLFFARED